MTNRTVLDGLLGRILVNDVELELASGLNFKGALKATFNPATGLIDIEVEPIMSCAVTSPAPNAVLPENVPVTITGTVSQPGAVVVKLDGVTLGSAMVVGLGWTYSWTPLRRDVANAGKLISATATSSATGAAGDAPSVPIKVSYLGSVATRASVPNNYGASTNPYTNRTYHETRDAIPALRVAWANVAIANAVGETSSGTQTTYGEVEYPAGVYTPLTWGGVDHVVAAPGTEPLCDPGPALPANTGFWLVSKQTGSVNVLYADGTQKSLALGDAQQAGGTNMHNVVNNGSNITFPSLIVGVTTKRSIMGIGDSRIAGFNDPTDATRKGNNGDFQTAFSPNYGGTRYGCVALTSATFASNHALALTQAAYHTDLLFELMINDEVAGTTIGSIRTLTASNIALFTALGLRVWLPTIDPAGVASSNYSDAAGQTIGVHDSVRVAHNADVRNGFYTGASGYFEYSDAVEHVRDDGKWKFDGTANKYTADGAHRTAFASQLSGPFILP